WSRRMNHHRVPIRWGFTRKKARTTFDYTIMRSLARLEVSAFTAKFTLKWKIRRLISERVSSTPITGSGVTAHTCGRA
ncbi:MAG TPA: hypothetical protein VGV15_10760, partial [Terriglobales bacterium]|nr:hypothetical protein [Terriglobales bacterium]